MLTMSTSVFKFDKTRKTLSIPRDSFYYDGRFPVELEVKSAHTGKVVKFVRDDEAYENNEGWDGEQMEYVPVDSVRNVERLIIYNGY